MKAARLALTSDALGCAVGAAVLGGARTLWVRTGLPAEARAGVVGALAVSAVIFGAGALRPTAWTLRGAAVLNGAWVAASAMALVTARPRPFGIGLLGAVGVADLVMGAWQGALARARRES